MILNLHLLRKKHEFRRAKIQAGQWGRALSPDGPGEQEKITHKVILGTQPLRPVLLQKALQDVSCRIRNIWFQLEGLVQNVVVHLSCVSAVKWRLKEGGQLLNTSLEVL